MKDGAVSEIEILEENDTPEYFERAKQIIDDIISNQSLNIDAVSEATYSSVGIINAVNNTLEAAAVDGELEKNSIEIPVERHHRHGGHGRKGRIEKLKIVSFVRYFTIIKEFAKKFNPEY